MIPFTDKTIIEKKKIKKALTLQISAVLSCELMINRTQKILKLTKVMNIHLGENIEISFWNVNGTQFVPLE